jgi:release factor glutamine methyltransferase
MDRPLTDSSDREPAYEPMMSVGRARKLREWQDAIFESQQGAEDVSMSYLGLELKVPRQVHAPPPMSVLLGQAVLDEVRDTDRVLEMGTGSGVNAILAASKSSDVVAVDVNPFAVESARRNASLNGVAARIDVRESDLFQRVDGTFDLIVIDPPFRWFAPRDLRERSTTDQGYATMTAFFREVARYLNAGGRILVFFGTSGDSDYLHKLIGEAKLETDKLSSREIVKDGLKVEYFVYRLTLTVPSPAG